MEAPLAFAFLAGTVSSANPCGFAVLPAFLMSHIRGGEDGGGAAVKVSHALLAGALMTVAFVAVFGLVGGGLALGAGALTSAMPWTTILIGVLFLVFGIRIVMGWPLPMRVPGLGAGKGSSSYPGPLVFGIAFGVASLSCTLPVFLAVVGASIGEGGILSRAAMFVAYALGMGVVVTALAVGVALARDGVGKLIRRLVPRSTRAGGVLLALAGAYLIYYWGFFLLPGGVQADVGKAPIKVVGDFAGFLQDRLTASGVLLPLGLAAAVAAVALGLLVNRGVWRSGSEEDVASRKGEIDGAT